MTDPVAIEKKSLQKKGNTSAQKTVHLPEKKSVNQLLLRCGFYGFALTQLNVMPSVHSGRFSKKRSLQSCTKIPKIFIY